MKVGKGWGSGKEALTRCHGVLTAYDWRGNAFGSGVEYMTLWCQRFLRFGLTGESSSSTRTMAQLLVGLEGTWVGMCPSHGGSPAEYQAAV